MIIIQKDVRLPEFEIVNAKFTNGYLFFEYFNSANSITTMSLTVIGQNEEILNGLSIEPGYREKLIIKNITKSDEYQIFPNNCRDFAKKVMI